MEGKQSPSASTEVTELKAVGPALPETVSVETKSAYKLLTVRSFASLTLRCPGSHRDTALGLDGTGLLMQVYQ